LTKSEITDHIEREVIEPVKAVNLGEFAMSGLGDCVPLSYEQFEILVHINFELSNTLSREGVGDGLALSGVLSSVSCVEKTAFDRDEGIVEVPAKLLIASNLS